MQTLRLKYRHLQSSYRCHRQREKTHFQMLLELLAKLFGSAFVSARLMQISLERHGIRRDIKVEDVLHHRSIDKQPEKHREILCGRLFPDVQNEQLSAIYRQQFGDKIPTVLADAEAICRHEFDLLGSGTRHWGNPIDWHMDPVSGYRWPKKFYSDINRNRRSLQGSDVKLPWEVSRMQHLPTLGKAYRLTKNERYAREIVEQINHWLEDNPCAYGVNWTCAMDVAIRIMNITVAFRFIEDAQLVTEEFKSRLAVSLFQHAQFTLFNLEHSIRSDGTIANGNHYLSNIVGLLHLGLVCPELIGSETWRRVGKAALIEEMDRQVHPDGGSFESSLSYHRLVLELFVAAALLCRLNGVTLSDSFWKKLEKMFEFLLVTLRPDGKVPQVGDADDGRLYILSDYGSWERSDFRYLLSIGAVLFKRGDMKAHAGKFSEEAFWLLGPEAMNDFTALEQDGRTLTSTALRNSGLYIMRSNGSYLLSSCGDVGTAGIGNHKHNDLLSFELYADDKAFIVDPGAYVYTRYPEWRNRFRATAYHNTVVVDGYEQNRFDADKLFEMAADASVIVHDWVSTPQSDWLDAEHRGYARLPDPVQHRRTFLLDKKIGSWTITDVLTGVDEHIADWYFHFDHGIELYPVGDGSYCTYSEGTNLMLTIQAEIPLVFRIEDGWVSRRYGQKLPAKILHAHGTFRGRCRVVTTIRTDQRFKGSASEFSICEFASPEQSKDLGEFLKADR
jgi:hypothetical protein